MSIHAESGRADFPERDERRSIPMNACPPGLSKSGMEAGRQPIDELMNRRGWTNHDLVNAMAGTGLTHKQVAKARRGRMLTLRMQEKILRAINQLAAAGIPVRREECFNYGGKQAKQPKGNRHEHGHPGACGGVSSDQ